MLGRLPVVIMSQCWIRVVSFGDCQLRSLCYNAGNCNHPIRGGQPCIAGTGLRVADIAIANLFHRRSPDEIAADYEISLAQVYAALAYYFEHKARLDSVIRQQIKTAHTLNT